MSITPASRLADMAVALRRMNNLRLGELADCIGRVIRDLDIDEPIELADTMASVAEKLQAYAAGMDYALGHISLCDGQEREIVYSRIHQIARMARDLREESKQVLRSAA